MSGNSYGKLFTLSTFGESHGPALGCVIDGCPPGIEISEADLQVDLDRRKPGTSRHTTQRREPDEVRILGGVFEGKTTGTSIGLLIENTDQRSKDYSNIKDSFRPAHADYTYHHKYGIRDYRGGGRSSARGSHSICGYRLPSCSSSIAGIAAAARSQLASLTPPVCPSTPTHSHSSFFFFPARNPRMRGP